MSADPEPKRSYTHEEMLARLRDSRSKGSSVKSEEREIDPESGRVRVRRNKKRRTPKGDISLFKDPKWFRFVRKAVFLGIPILALVMVLGYVVLMASVGAGRFQQGVGRSLARQWGLAQPVEIKDTSLSALVLSIGQTKITGADNLPVQSAVADGSELRLGIKSLLGGDWDAEFCTVHKAVLVLQTPAGSDTASHRSPPLRAAGFLLSDEPSAIRFSEISIWNTSILFGGSDPLVAPGLRNLRAAFSRRDQDNGGSVYFDGQLSGGREGKLTLPGWPEMRVEAVRMAIHPQKARILRSAFHFGEEEEGRTGSAERNVIEATGEVPFEAGKSASLNLAVRGVMLRTLLPKGVKRYCDAVLRSEKLELAYDTNQPLATWRINGPVALDLTRLRGLQVLGLLQEASGADLATVDFDECSFHLAMAPGTVAIQDFRALSTGKMQITGSIRVDADGRLDGDLRVGLAQEIMLQRIPPFFKPGEEGFLWAEVKLGGTNLAPTEDLSPRLQSWSSGTGEAMPRPTGVPEPASSSGSGTEIDKKDEWEDMFKTLTEPGRRTE